MTGAAEVLGAVHRGEGDAAWQQSGKGTVFALLAGGGSVGPLLDRMERLQSPSPEELAEVARQAGIVSSSSPMLLGAISETQLVLFGSAGASCRLLRPGGAQDLLDASGSASFSTGQCLLRPGDVLLCSAGEALLELPPAEAATGLPDRMLMRLKREETTSPEVPLAVLRLGSPSAGSVKTEGRSRRRGFLAGLVLILIVGALAASALLLPWREALGLRERKGLLPPETEVLLVGGGGVPGTLGSYLNGDSVPAVQGVEEGVYAAVETAPQGVEAVERIIILRDTTSMDMAAGVLIGELNYFQRGRTVVLNQSGSDFRHPGLDLSQLALYIQLPRMRGASLLVKADGDVRDLRGELPEGLPGPAYRAVVIR